MDIDRALLKIVSCRIDNYADSRLSPCGAHIGECLPGDGTAPEYDWYLPISTL